MALKRINKELTDLGRYVISPFIPLAIVSSPSQPIVARCKVGCLLLVCCWCCCYSERGICSERQNTINPQPCSIHDANKLSRGDETRPDGFKTHAETTMLTFHRQ